MKRSSEASEDLYREELAEINAAAEIMNNPVVLRRFESLRRVGNAAMMAAGTSAERDEAWHALKALDKLEAEFTTLIGGKDTAIRRIQKLQQQRS